MHHDGNNEDYDNPTNPPLNANAENINNNDHNDHNDINNNNNDDGTKPNNISQQHQDHIDCKQQDLQSQSNPQQQQSQSAQDRDTAMLALMFSASGVKALTAAQRNQDIRKADITKPELAAITLSLRDTELRSHMPGDILQSMDKVKWLDWLRNKLELAGFNRKVHYDVCLMHLKVPGFKVHCHESVKETEKDLNALIKQKKIEPTWKVSPWMNQDERKLNRKNYGKDKLKNRINFNKDKKDKKNHGNNDYGNNYQGPQNPLQIQYAQQPNIATQPPQPLTYAQTAQQQPQHQPVNLLQLPNGGFVPHPNTGVYNPSNFNTSTTSKWEFYVSK